jgi:FixJ family two-component response regulator
MNLSENKTAVFVIDDDASVRESVRSLLGSVGFQAQVFASTDEFMKCNRSDNASCLVLDVKLPGTNGLDFQDQLQRAGIHIPIVFITGHGTVPMTLRAMKAGAVEFLAKPFQKDDLVAAIRQALERDRVRREDEAEFSSLRSRIERIASRERQNTSDIALLNKMASRLAASDPLHQVLDEVVEFVAAVVSCDSCLIYVLEGDELVLRASKNDHPEAVGFLKMKLGQGIAGWVAEHKSPVAIGESAYADPRFEQFSELPEDRFEALLSVPLVRGGQLIGVINLQNRLPHHYSSREINLVATLGFLVGAEVERARLEGENSELSDKLERRKIIDRAKGILQTELKISEDEAYRAMQRESQKRRKSMKDIAESIVMNDELKRSAR